MLGLLYFSSREKFILNKEIKQSKQFFLDKKWEKDLFDKDRKYG